MPSARRSTESRRAASSGVKAPDDDGGSDEMRWPGGAEAGARVRSDEGGAEELRGEFGGGRSEPEISAEREASLTRAKGTLPVEVAVARNRPVSVSFCEPTGAAESAP